MLCFIPTSSALPVIPTVAHRLKLSRFRTEASASMPCCPHPPHPMLHFSVTTMVHLPLCHIYLNIYLLWAQAKPWSLYPLAFSLLSTLFPPTLLSASSVWIVSTASCGNSLPLPCSHTPTQPQSNAVVSLPYFWWLSVLQHKVRVPWQGLPAQPDLC